MRSFSEFLRLPPSDGVFGLFDETLGKGKILELFCKTDEAAACIFEVSGARKGILKVSGKLIGGVIDALSGPKFLLLRSDCCC